MPACGGKLFCIYCIPVIERSEFLDAVGIGGVVVIATGSGVSEGAGIPGTVIEDIGYR